MRCLVLGSGFIGTRVAHTLVERGVHVSLLSRSPWKLNGLMHTSGIDVIAGDFGDPATLKVALQRTDCVINVAGGLTPGKAEANPHAAVAADLLPSLTLLRCLEERPVPHLIYFSSGGAVYGVAKELPIKEDHPANPISVYGITKLTIEHHVRALSGRSEVGHTILRCANAYGERQPGVGDQGIIAVFLRRLAKRQAVPVWGPLDRLRDYVYVGDVAEAVSAVAVQRCLGTFNLGTGIGTTTRELLGIMRCLVTEPTVELRPARSFDVPTNVLDASALTEATGWRPTTDIETGIGRVWHAVKGEHLTGRLEEPAYAAQ